MLLSSYEQVQEMLLPSFRTGAWDMLLSSYEQVQEMLLSSFSY